MHKQKRVCVFILLFPEAPQQQMYFCNSDNGHAIKAHNFRAMKLDSTDAEILLFRHFTDVKKQFFFLC